jgi:hypothetical protein
LARQIDFAGKSGALYRYATLEEERTLPPVGANYVIAQVTPEGNSILYAGETSNLASRDWRSALDAAQDQFQQAQVLTRLNVRSAIREAELDDIIQQHSPPLNAG